MSLLTRLCVFASIALAGMLAWQWNAATDASRDVTQLAVQQFQNEGAVPERLQQTSLAQNWWPLAWPLMLLLLAAVMFWEDVERWFKNDDSA